MENTTLTGTWEFLNNPESNRKYQLIWDHGRFINRMTMAEDGRSAIMHDETNKNAKWNVRKLNETDTPPASGKSTGTTNWFGNKN